jgi:hypothetical protein
MPQLIVPGDSLSKCLRTASIDKENEQTSEGSRDEGQRKEWRRKSAKESILVLED